MLRRSLTNETTSSFWMQSDALARVTRRLHRRKRRGDLFAIEKSRSGAARIESSQGSRAISADGHERFGASARSDRCGQPPHQHGRSAPSGMGSMTTRPDTRTPHAGVEGRGGSRSQGAVPWVPSSRWGRRFATCATDMEATPRLAQVRRTQSEKTSVSSSCDAQVADKANGSSVGVRWSPHRRWSLATARQPGLPVRW